MAISEHLNTSHYYQIWYHTSSFSRKIRKQQIKQTEEIMKAVSLQCSKCYKRYINHVSGWTNI